MIRNECKKLSYQQDLIPNSHMMAYDSRLLTTMGMEAMHNTKQSTRPTYTLMRFHWAGPTN